VVVSSGIPLPPGYLLPSDVGTVRVVVNGVEQALYVEALGRVRPDGSVRSVLVQFAYAVPASGTVAGTLLVKQGARPGPDRAKVTPSGNPQAVVLPSDPAYLVSTRLGGALQPLSQAGLGAAWQAQSADFATYANRQWPSPGAAWGSRGIALYEHPLNYYQQWLRTGEVIWWQRATAMALNYRDGWAIPNRNQAVQWLSNTEGMAVHYFVTGDPVTQRAVGDLAEFMEHTTEPGYTEPSLWLGGVMGDGRGKARTLMAAIDAWEVGAATGTYYLGLTGRTGLTQNITDILGSQQANGGFGGTQYSNGQKSYMAGMQVTALIRYYDEVSADPRIPPAVKRNLDYTWTTAWVPASQAFKYVNLYVSSNDPDTPEPGLNGLLLPGYAWYGNYFGDATSQSRADQILAGLRTAAPNWNSWYEQFDQAYYRVFNAMAWRHGVN